MKKSFEPKIVGFVCNWCTYAAADSAGANKIEYPPNIVLVRLMCSGRVDPLFVVSALKKGADGVLIGGCHTGDCHYQTGNRNALKKITIFKDTLETLGIDPRRVRLEWISASEGQKFATVIGEFVKELKELGPNSI